MTQDIIQLFKKYGFDYRKSSSSDNFMAFTYKTGFFHNAELISLNNEDRERIDAEMEVKAKELQLLGFSTKKSFYDSFTEIERNLFDGFFNVEHWKERVKTEYRSHCEKILNSLPVGTKEYSYIHVPFIKNDRNIDVNIIDDICNSMLSDEPILTIVEAPAGFGKTCTSYEIINRLVTTKQTSPLPFFTEFSRDRQARIFSHILHREVDRTFNSVKSEVVIEEIKQGKIVVVLDGFDEILHDNSSKESDEMNFENAEPMLETISEMLINKAKVILTSRKSAIFDGEIFNDWIAKYDNKFTINRYKLDKPEITDWLPIERLESLNNCGVQIDKLANPVLLSYLRFINDKEFQKLCNNPTEIVEQYFISMMEREKERQQLLMTIEQQNEFLTLIANDMAIKNYTSDNKEKLINTIKDRAGYLLNAMRGLYSGKDRPTIDKLATTLSNHAFFDRSNQDETKIEFINEFVFGNYLARDILNTPEWIASDERFVEPAVLSYAPRTFEQRTLLWKNLESMNLFLDKSSKMKFEAILTDKVDESDYCDSEISSINFKDISIFKNSSITGSIFNSCTFKNSEINLNNFIETTFLSCQFWDCDYSLSSVEENNISFYNCRSNGDLTRDSDDDASDVPIEKSDYLTEIELFILNKIWPSGNNSIERLHHYIGILKDENYAKRDILKSIRSLKRKGLLNSAHNVNFIEINKESIAEIKTILGRV